MMALSSVDGITPVALWADPVTHRLLVTTASLTLDELTDVVITGGAQGDILYHNGTNWVNLPAGTNGHFLKTQGAGANPAWAAVSATPGGADTQVQFNDGGAFGGDAGLVFNKATNVLTAGGFVGPLTGDVTGNVSGTAATVTEAAQPNITSVGTLTSLASGAITSTGLLTVTVAGNAGLFTNSSDAASVQVAIFQGDRATMADDDEAYVSYKLSDDAGTQTEVARLTWVATDVNAGTSVDGRLDFSVMSAGALSKKMRLTGTSFEPTTTDGLALGNAFNLWSDLFLALGGTINFNGGDVVITHSSNLLTITSGDLAVPNLNIANLGQINFNGGDVTVTHAANALLFEAATSGYKFDNIIAPLNSDGAAIGSTTLMWSDLFLASGAVVNFNNGDVTVTHAANKLTFAGGTYEFDGAVSPTANDGAALGTTALGWADLYLATGGNVLVNNANAKRTMILSAAGGSPTTTIGCGGPTKVEAGTNDIDYWALEFDTTTEERAFWVVQMPDNYDGSTITAVFVWTNAGGASTQTVRWGIKARAYADSDAIDQAYGTEVTVDDTWLAQGDIHVSAATSAITIGGSPAGGQLVVFNVGRKVANDDMAGDARLLMVKIEYGINAYSD